MNYKSYKGTSRVRLGHGVISQLEEYNNGKMALILDDYLRESSIFKDLEEKVLVDLDYKIICTVETEPTFGNIDPYIKDIRKYEPDYIVAIGGGSTIDTAKALLMFYELHDLNWETAVSEPLPIFPKETKLIAIPTTSGTGAEATGAAVYKKYDGTKAMIISDRIRPHEVFLDYNLITTVPKTVVAHSGVDALAHVLGAMSCKNASRLDKMICTQAAVTIMKNLSNSYNGDMNAKISMHISAYLAGVEINNAGGGLEHKLDMFAKNYNLPHGLVIGIFLPYTMLYLLPENHYIEIAEQLGLQGNNREKQMGLINMIWEMYDEIGIPRTIKETGVPENEFIGNIPKYIEQVKEIGHIYLIQGFKGEDTLEELYKQSYYGI